MGQPWCVEEMQHATFMLVCHFVLLPPYALISHTGPRYHSHLHSLHLQRLQTTRSGEGTPSGLAAPTLESVDATSVRVSWTAPSDPSGVIVSYEVLRGETVVFTGSDLSFTDTGLTPSVT